MSLFKNNLTPVVQTAAPTEDTRPKPQVYLNIGLNMPMTNPETGEVEDVFVAIPFGLGLDTMEHMEIRGNSKSWAHMVQAKNYILDELKKLGEAIGPGEDQVVEGLQVQIKRVGQAAAPSADENPLLSAITGRLKVAA